MTIADQAWAELHMRALLDLDAANARVTQLEKENAELLRLRDSLLDTIADRDLAR